jgi:hypothetical protein
MRPSNWLFLITLSLSFAIGFGLGAFPYQWQKFFGGTPQSLVVLLPEARLLPRSFLLDFEKATGIDVDVKVVDTYLVFRSEAQNADLLLAPLSWLGNDPETLSPVVRKDAFHRLLSADFQSLPFELKNFLPVFWKTEFRGEKTHLIIWGFAIPKDRDTEGDKLIEFLIRSKQRLKNWTMQTGLGSTFQSSNVISDFPDELRALRMRDISLPNLLIEQKIEEAQP